jgi:hypothetical protein
MTYFGPLQRRHERTEQAATCQEPIPAPIASRVDPRPEPRVVEQRPAYRDWVKDYL